MCQKIITNQNFVSVNEVSDLYKQIIVNIRVSTILLLQIPFTIHRNIIEGSADLLEQNLFKFNKRGLAKENE